MYLFSYGSLQQEEVQLLLYNRILIGSKDELKGFKLAEKLLDFKYPIIFETKSISDKVSGIVFEITIDELRNTDEYEGEYYQRVRVKLASGREAWCYVMQQ